MNEKLKNTFWAAWHEPRRFFLWLALLSLLGLAAGYASDELKLAPSNLPFWVQTCACACAVALAAGVLAGFLGFVLSWIPPVRRLLARMLPWRFFLLACVATLIALFYTVENWRGKRAWEQFKREHEAKGEYFDLAKLAPPPVPDDQNFAMAPIMRAAQLRFEDRPGQKTSIDTNGADPLDMPIEALDSAFQPLAKDLWAPAIGSWQKGLKTDLAAWQQYYRKVAALTNLFPIPPQPQTPAADVLLALSRYDSVIEQLRQAGQRPYSRFPLQYDTDNPVMLLLPQYATLRHCVITLRLRTIAELNLGQTDKALDDIKLMLRLTDAIRTEPVLISHLVRIAMVSITLQPVWEGMADHRWSDAQLAALSPEFGKLDFLADYRVSMLGEQACAAETVDWFRRSRDPSIFEFDDSGLAGKQIEAIVARLAPAGWFYQNQLSIVRFENQYYLPLADEQQRVVSPAGVRRAQAAFAADVTNVTPCNVLEGSLLPALSAGVTKFASAQANVDLARVACALERYRLAHGEYPEALDALGPQFIAKLPHDIINGQPLHYRRLEDGGFALYSVGWNETDDGGEVALGKEGALAPRKGDWVWRLPQ